MPTDTTKPTGATTIPTGGDVATTALQDKLVSSAEAISSFTTGAEKAVQEQIAGTKLATEKGSAAIASAFEREKGYAATKGETALTTAAEGERGYGRVLGTYRELAGNTDKEVKDLEQRKQELIMQNDAAGLKEVNTLITNSLTFKQNAMQQTFSNLLGIAGFTTQKRAQDIAEKAQSFTERSAVAGIALKYGVSVNPGDTLDTVLSKIPSGAVTKEEAMNLAKTASEIKLNNARAAEALQGTLPISGDASSIDAFASAARFSPDFLGTLNKHPDILSKTINRIQSMEQESAVSLAQNAINAGMSIQEAKAAMAKNPTNYQRSGQSAIEKIIDDEYAKQQSTKQKEKSSGVLGAFSSPGATTKTVDRAVIGINRFLFGE